MYFAFFIFCTALIENCCFGQVASRDQQCLTFMYENPSCPKSWHYWGNSCYKITETTFTWADANDECRQLGGVLALPSSDQENNFIANTFQNVEHCWIDCNDLDVEGSWECREGNVDITYRNWYAGEPNNSGDEDCAVLSRIGGNKREWHDVKCSRAERALCKIAGRPLLHV